MAIIDGSSSKQNLSFIGYCPKGLNQQFFHQG